MNFKRFLKALFAFANKTPSTQQLRYRINERIQATLEKNQQYRDLRESLNETEIAPILALLEERARLDGLNPDEYKKHPRTRIHEPSVYDKLDFLPHHSLSELRPKTWHEFNVISASSLKPLEWQAITDLHVPGFVEHLTVDLTQEIVTCLCTEGIREEFFLGWKSSYVPIPIEVVTIHHSQDIEIEKLKQYLSIPYYFSLVAFYPKGNSRVKFKLGDRSDLQFIRQINSQDIPLDFWENRDVFSDLLPELEFVFDSLSQLLAYLKMNPDLFTT